ncbi:MAG: ThiF family adenylyltransferase [Henriciella sp.]|nr:ThiF family adenylyltransferase [Henriciella sp.]
MSALDLSMLAPHALAARSLLAGETGIEAAGYLLFGRSNIAKDPWSLTPRTRYVSRDFIPIPGEDFVDASETHIRWKTAGFMCLLTDARNANAIPAIIHTHPNGRAVFSAQDDKNEAMLARTVAIKGLPGLISIVIDGAGIMTARVWRDQNQFEMIDEISEIGRRLSFPIRAYQHAGPCDALDRQARLFGEVFNRTISGLRVGVCGGGATGSATMAMLNRLGVGRLLMIDKDRIETTNLNRVHGAHLSDVENGLHKVDLAEREIEASGLGAHFVGLKAWAGDHETWDALKSCDVIFGCTDDHGGRLFLNRFAHYYGIPVIDMGLRMRPRGGESVDVSGRVSTLVPGHACLLCQNVIDPQLAAEDGLKRGDPHQYERLKAEAYVKGGGDPAPAVVTFTSEIASVAVNELIAGITGFQGSAGMHARRTRRFHACDDRFPQNIPRAGCPLCDTNEKLGLADCDPFLEMVI